MPEAVHSAAPVRAVILLLLFLTLCLPAPLIRVPEGTELRMTIHNLLRTAAVIHGMHQHPGNIREISFTAGVPGTYEYWASAGGDMTYTQPQHENPVWWRNSARIDN
jgi:hypothetical protein